MHEYETNILKITLEITTAKYKVMYLFLKKYKSKYVIYRYFIIKLLSDVHKYACLKEVNKYIKVV